MKRIFTLGTFDLLHYGHINFLRRARGLGDSLTVGLSTDNFVRFKRKIPYFNYAHRKMMLDAVKYVDEIIPESSFETEIEDAISGKFDILVMGDDYEGKFDHLREKGIQVIYLSRTVAGETPISSRQIKEYLNYIKND